MTLSRTTSIMVLIALLAGFAGAALAVRLLAPRPTSAQGTAISAGSVSAGEFRLVDTSGRIRAVLATTPTGEAGLVIGDRDGRTRAVLSVKSDATPTLELRDQDNKLRAVLSMAGDGTPGLDILDGNEQRRIQLGFQTGPGTDGSASIYLTDDQQRRRVVLVGGGPDGGARLHLHDENEVSRIDLSILPSQGGARMSVTDGQITRLALGVAPDGSPNIGIWDAAGAVIWSAPPGSSAAVSAPGDMARPDDDRTVDAHEPARITSP